MNGSRFAILLAIVVLASGCTQSAPSASPGDEDAPEPCGWVTNETACTRLSNNVSGLDWVEEQRAVLAGSATGFADPDPRAQARLLVADTLGERWSITVEDSATEPPVLAGASGEVFLELDGRQALFYDDRGRVQASQTFEPLAWTGWASPHGDVFAVETIPDSIGLDLNFFDLERDTSYTASLGEKWTMQDGADNVWWMDNGTRAIFAVSTYGGEASTSDPACFWLDVRIDNQTHTLAERDCAVEPEGVLADGLLASREDQVLALAQNFTVQASRTVPDLSTLVRFADGERVVANRADIGTDRELPAILLDEQLDEIATLPGGTLSGFGASPYEDGCLGLAEGAPNDGRSLRIVDENGTSLRSLEIEPGKLGRTQTACDPDGEHAAIALGSQLARVALDG